MAWVLPRPTRHRVFFVLLLSFIAGVLIHSFIQTPLPAELLLILSGLFVVGAIFISEINTRTVFGSVAALTFGLFIYALSFPAVGAGTISEYYDSQVRLEGVSVKEVSSSSHGQTAVLSSLKVNGREIQGKISVSLSKYPVVSYGDELSFIAVVEEPKASSDFRYDRWLLKEGITATGRADSSVVVLAVKQGNFIRQPILDSKNWIVNRFNQNLSEPHSAYLAGLVLGAKKSLPDDLKEAFQLTGTSHVVAASGYNVSVVSLILFALLTRLLFRRDHAFWLVIVGIAAYVIIAGADAAVTRAGIMGALVLYARHIGRAVHTPNLLAFVAVIMLLFNPRLLVDDVGFELSFAATAALIYLAPRIERYFEFVPESLGIREALVCSLAATIMTLPIIIGRFGMLSIVSPIVNLLVLPFIPYAMLLSPLALIGGVLVAPVWALLDIMLRIVYMFAGVPFAAVEFDALRYSISLISFVGVSYYLVWLYLKEKRKSYSVVRS